MPTPLTTPTESQPVATQAPSADPSRDEEELKTLADALRETPFSAIAQRLSVDVVPLGSDEVKFVYHVRVIERIRGPKLKDVTYYSIAEKGEEPSSDKEPVILTLCKDGEGFYWPGTGAQFEPTQDARAVVDEVRPQLSANQKVFAQCAAP